MKKVCNFSLSNFCQNIGPALVPLIKSIITGNSAEIRNKSESDRGAHRASNLSEQLSVADKEARWSNLFLSLAVLMVQKTLNFQGCVL